MYYICFECGHIFEEGEEGVFRYTHGFTSPPYDERLGCPICGGTYEIAKRCGVCGKLNAPEEMTGSVCDCCIEKYKYDVDMCFKIGAKAKTSVDLNCFLISLFSEAEIEEIIFAKLKEEQKNVQIDCDKFIEEDRDWFAERLEQEVKKNENCKK